MVRPLRIEYPGALYHVMSRGNAYQDIFVENKDRSMFLENLKKCVESHNLICHAYCLMNNHYHLLLETLDGNLSQAMRDINGNYTQKFNARHKRIGHVLQGRYKALVVEKEVYLLEVERYIVLNPVRAGIVDNPMEWKWSSYNATVGRVKAPIWLETKWTLRLFSNKIKEAQKQYKQFIQFGIDSDSPLNNIKEGIVIGSPQFIDSIWEEFSDLEELKEVKTSDRMIGRPSLEDVFSGVMNKKERDDVIKMARIRGAYSLTEIANYLNLHRSTVSKIFNKKK